MWTDWTLLNKNEVTKEDDIEEGTIIETKQLNSIFIKIFTSTKPYRYWI
jgi:hypothetical protein